MDKVDKATLKRCRQENEELHNEVIRLQRELYCQKRMTAEVLRKLREEQGAFWSMADTLMAPIPDSLEHL